MEQTCNKFSMNEQERFLDWLKTLRWNFHKYKKALERKKNQIYYIMKILEIVLIITDIQESRFTESWASRLSLLLLRVYLMGMNH